MNGKHTPGPWRVSPTGLSVWSGDQDESSFARICVKPEGKVSKREDQDWPANAHLIAAAPEGLELAEEIMWQTDGHDSLDFLKLRRMAMNLISKSRGATLRVKI